jgi:tetratricopeptide (TPR) repeat protein
VDETDEEAYRALMQAHLEAGNRREAIRQFERLRDVLREHIGVGPDPTTIALYEQVLAMEGDEPTSPAERAAALLANGLVAWSRGDVAEAERLARSARALALDAGLGHQLGEASTLLALVAYAKGTWHEVFREHFVESLSRPDLETAVFDAHLCFQEFYLHGPEGHAAAYDFARELLAAARDAGSAAGTALATLLLGEFQLLSGDVRSAVETLGEAARYAEDGHYSSTISIALERLAEAHIALGNHEEAQRLLAKARTAAEQSGIPSHCVVRILGMEVRAANGPIDALRAVGKAERWLAEQFHVCEPCSMTLHIESARVCARTGDLTRARRHLDAVEHISRLWTAGPWQAATWELRAELRRAQGDVVQASALFLEAADGFAAVHRPGDESRCREAAALAGAVT